MLFSIMMVLLSVLAPRADSSIKSARPRGLMKRSDDLRSAHVDRSVVRADIHAWRNGYRSCQYEVCEVVGSDLPKDISGTYFRNGFAKFEIGKDRVVHPFDGDGMLAAVSISNGTATFRNRFIKTNEYKEEMAADRMLYRGAFGTKPRRRRFKGVWPPLAMHIKNVANTNVLYWAGKLLALWEQGLPYQLDPSSLRTQGKSTIGGLLSNDQPFSAHPRIDPKSGRLINFSVQTGPLRTTVKIYEFDEKFGLHQPVREVDIPGFAFFHDFAVTENYYIFNQAPCELDILSFLIGSKGPAECVKFRADKSNFLYLIPRDASLPVQTVEVDSHFSFHFANAYEVPSVAMRSSSSLLVRYSEGASDGVEGRPYDKDECTDLTKETETSIETIVVDLVAARSMQLGTADVRSDKHIPVWEDIDYEHDVPPSKLVRYTLSRTLLGAGEVVTAGNGDSAWKYSKKLLSDATVDFPVVHPRASCSPHRFIFASAGVGREKASPLQGLIKIDTVTRTETRWFGKPYEFLGEPCFIERSPIAVSPDRVPADTDHIAVVGSSSSCSNAARSNSGRDFDVDAEGLHLKDDNSCFDIAKNGVRDYAGDKAVTKVAGDEAKTGVREGRVDTERGIGPGTGTGKGTGEGSEDDGYIGCFAFNGRLCSSEFLLFDAADIARGPVHRSKITNTVLPHGLHGTFVQGYCPASAAVISSFSRKQ